MLFGALNASASGLTAERLRMDLIASNIANANTTRTPQGGPYRRELPVFMPMSSGGVEVAAVVADPSPFRQRYDPGSPDANAQGYVLLPNVSVTAEMVDLVAATQAYQANVTAFDAAKSNWQAALQI